MATLPDAPWTSANEARFRAVDTSDPDEMAAGMAHVDVRYIPLAPAQGRWRLQSLDLGAVSIHRGRVGGLMTGLGAVAPGYVCLALRLDGKGLATLNRQEVHRGVVASMGQSTDFAMRRDDSIEWGVVMLPMQSLARRCEEGTGRELRFPRGLRLHRLALPDALALGRVVREAMRLAREGCQPEHGWQAVEHRLLDFGVRMLAERSCPGERPAYRHLLKRTNAFLESHSGERLTAAELCAGLHVGERTLRRFFVETYGDSPAHYVRLQRIAAVRRMLVEAPWRRAAITTAAVSQGFFELGRFAADYRAAVGEKPSATLAAARRRRAA